MTHETFISEGDLLFYPDVYTIEKISSPSKFILIFLFLLTQLFDSQERNLNLDLWEISCQTLLWCMKKYKIHEEFQSDIYNEPWLNWLIVAKKNIMMIKLDTNKRVFMICRLKPFKIVVCNLWRGIFVTFIKIGFVWENMTVENFKLQIKLLTLKMLTQRTMNSLKIFGDFLNNKSLKV